MPEKRQTVTPEEARAALVGILNDAKTAEEEWGYLGILNDAGTEYEFFIPEKPGYIHCMIQRAVGQEYAECVVRVALDPFVPVKFVRFKGVLVATEFDPLRAVEQYAHDAPALGVPSLPLPDTGGVFPPPVFGSPVTKILDAGVASAGNDRFIILAAETGTADDCIELQGLAVGDEAWLFADTGDTITLKHNDSGATDKFLFSGEADIELSGSKGLKVVKKATGAVVNSVGEEGGALATDDGTTTVDPTTQLTFDPSYFDVTDNGGGNAEVTLIAAADAADVTYTPTTGGDWLVPPDDVEEAADELAGRVKAIEDAGGGGIGDYVLITDQKTQNTPGGTFTSGADRTRDLNTKVDSAEVASILKLAFTSGGTYEIVVGDVITGATSTETADVFDVELTSGSWAGGDAAGNLWLNNQSGAFSAENLDVGGNTNVATIAADSTTNQVRLSAGTWRITASAPAHRVAQHQAWWQNISDSARVVLGTSEYEPTSPDATTNRSWVRGRFTIAAKKTFELQHRCASTFGTGGFGTNVNLNAEVYSVVELVRE